jgi:sec-independent protein translocase protein TatC
MADVKMPLTAHLAELRSRLIRALIAVGAGFLACYAFADALFKFLAHPLLLLTQSPGQEETVRLIGTGIGEAFFTKLKVAVIGGVFLATPVVLYQLWKFVVPGLYDSEKRYARPFVIFGTFFFVAGAAFCYSLVMPVGYAFFIEEYGTLGVSPEIRISEYLTFTSRMLLAFGVIFELPVATFFLARIGLITHRTMIEYGRYSIVAIFIVAAILTPADVASQLLMAGPMLVLYGLSIGVAYFFGRQSPAATAADEVGIADEGSEP